MWDVLSTAVTGIKDALGIELPELPTDLTALGDAATGVVATATEALPDVASVTDAAAQGVSDVTDALTAPPTTS